MFLLLVVAQEQWRLRPILGKMGRMEMLEDIETLYIVLPYTAVNPFKRVKMPFSIPRQSKLLLIYLCRYLYLGRYLWN